MSDSPELPPSGCDVPKRRPVVPQPRPTITMAPTSAMLPFVIIGWVAAFVVLRLLDVV